MHSSQPAASAMFYSAPPSALPGSAFGYHPHAHAHAQPHPHAHSPEASLSAIHSKLEEMSSQLKAWSQPTASAHASVSCKDVIKCLAAMQGEHEDATQQISSLSLEVRTLEE